MEHFLDIGIPFPQFWFDIPMVRFLPEKNAHAHRKRCQGGHLFYKHPLATTERKLQLRENNVLHKPPRKDSS